MPGIDTKLRPYLAAYAVLLVTVVAVGVMVVLLVRAEGRVAASERARPCAGTQQQRGCLVVEHTAVVEKRYSGDPDTYDLTTAAGRAVVDAGFYDAVRVGDEVDLVLYDGEVVRVSQGGRTSLTGAYTGDVDGYLILFGVAVTMATVAVLLTVAVHRRGDFEGMVLFWAVVLAPLPTMVCGLLTEPHLRAAVGAFGAAAISGAVLAAVTAALVVRAVDSTEPPVFRRGPRLG